MMDPKAGVIGFVFSAHRSGGRFVSKFSRGVHFVLGSSFCLRLLFSASLVRSPGVHWLRFFRGTLWMPRRSPELANLASISRVGILSNMEPVSDLRATYRERHATRRAELDSLGKRSSLIGYLRLAVFVLAASLAWLAFGRSALSPWWLLVPVLLFGVLVVWHSRTDRRQTLVRRAVRFYDRGLLRLDDAWAGTGERGDAFQNPDHIYAADLDIFGKGSLFELLSLARTATGEETLAAWLLAPAPRDEVLDRQSAAKELSTRLDLREDIALLGDDVRAEVHPKSLVAWSTAPVVLFPRYVPMLGLLLAGLATTAIIAFFVVKAVPISAVLVAFVFNAIFIVWLRHRVAQVLGSVETPAGDLRILHLLIGRLENEHFESKKLAALEACLRVDGNIGQAGASARIARLERLTEWHDSSHHVLMSILAPVLLFREQLAYALEAWRRENGEHIAAWLSAAGEFEALSSLACLASERPHWTFPTLVEDAHAHISAEGLTHPLIPAARAVANDVAIGQAPHNPDTPRLWIISGSNMSGKSTLLRAVGLNTVLASAGAPVAARSFCLSPLQPGASIRTTDSLQEGRSRFYAEITRIRQIMDRSESSPPVLFLLDELLSGTNSHDRLIGAEAVVKGLLARGAIGCLTTHDLALSNLAGDLSLAADNVHFDDKITDGRVEFDYHLQPGVVTRSNALALMRAVGLDV
jgi:hypothetical protein